MWSLILEVIEEVLDALKQAVDDLFTGLITILTNLANNIFRHPAFILQAVMTAFREILATILDFFNATGGLVLFSLAKVLSRHIDERKELKSRVMTAKEWQKQQITFILDVANAEYSNPWAMFRELIVVKKWAGITGKIRAILNFAAQKLFIGWLVNLMLAFVAAVIKFSAILNALASLYWMARWLEEGRWDKAFLGQGTKRKKWYAIRGSRTLPAGGRLAVIRRRDPGGVKP